MVAEDAERLWQKLRLTNVEHERLASMAEGWRRMSPAFGEPARARCSIGWGRKHFTDHALLGWARSQALGADDADWHALATLPQRWTAPVFPLKAADFIKRGVEKGPALGAALRAAEAAWIAAGFPMDETALAAIADRRAIFGNNSNATAPAWPGIQVYRRPHDILSGDFAEFDPLRLCRHFTLAARAGRGRCACLPPWSAACRAMAPAR